MSIKYQNNLFTRVIGDHRGGLFVDCVYWKHPSLLHSKEPLACPLTTLPSKHLQKHALHLFQVRATGLSPHHPALQTPPEARPTPLPGKSHWPVPSPLCPPNTSRSTPYTSSR